MKKVYPIVAALTFIMLANTISAQVLVDWDPISKLVDEASLNTGNTANNGFEVRDAGYGIYNIERVSDHWLLTCEAKSFNQENDTLATTSTTQFEIKPSN